MARHLLRLSTSVWVSWLTIYSLSSTSATQNGGRLSGTSSAGRPSVHPAAGLRTRDLKHPGNTCLHSFLVLSAVPGRHHIALRHLVHKQRLLHREFLDQVQSRAESQMLQSSTTSSTSSTGVIPPSRQLPGPARANGTGAAQSVNSPSPDLQVWTHLVSACCLPHACDWSSKSGKRGLQHKYSFLWSSQTYPQYVMHAGSCFPAIRHSCKACECMPHMHLPDGDCAAAWSSVELWNTSHESWQLHTEMH